MKLESALARLRTDRRIAVLHYAPIRATVENEPVEIFPFLGCSRLEDPLNRYPVTAVVHGHAHNGCPEGRTSGGSARVQRLAPAAPQDGARPAPFPHHRGPRRIGDEVPRTAAVFIGSMSPSRLTVAAEARPGERYVAPRAC